MGWRDGIKKPCKGFDSVARLDDLTMNTLIGDGQGCVITLFRSIPATEDASKGFYSYGKLSAYNSYANTDEYEKMRTDQLSKLQQNRKLGKEGDSGTKDGFFLLSWTMTLGVNDIVTPLADRAAIAQSSLFWSAYLAFTPYSYPNVIYVDFVGQPYLLDQGKSQADYLKQMEAILQRWLWLSICRLQARIAMLVEERYERAKLRPYQKKRNEAIIQHQRRFTSRESLL